MARAGGGARWALADRSAAPALSRFLPKGLVVVVGNASSRAESCEKFRGFEPLRQPCRREASKLDRHGAVVGQCAESPSAPGAGPDPTTHQRPADVPPGFPLRRALRHGPTAPEAMLRARLKPQVFSRPRPVLARAFGTGAPWQLKAMPPRPKPPSDDELDESFLKGSGPGGQKIVTTLRYSSEAVLLLSNVVPLARTKPTRQCS